LCGEDLRLKSDNLFDLRGGQGAIQLQMTCSGGASLRFQAEFARIRHHVHLDQPSGFGIPFGGLSVLADESADAERVCRNVLQVCHGSRPAIDRYRRRGTVQSKGGAVVTSCRVANNFDVELRLDGASVGGFRRPWKENPEQPSGQQQGMRFSVAAGQIRAVLAVDGGEERILPIRRLPALLNRLHAEAHGIGRLMACHAGSAVSADRFKEGVAFGLDSSGRIQNG
jgi:hypothetical protein